MHPVPHEYPVCPGELSVNRLDCSDCDPVIEDHLLATPFVGGAAQFCSGLLRGKITKTTMKTKKAAHAPLFLINGNCATLA